MIRSETIALVVDANIAQSAGTSESQMSIDSREFLENLRECDHRIVLSLDIDREWNRHLTEYSSEWLTAMTNADKVLHLGNVQNENLRNRIVLFAPDGHILKILQEDIHLLEAALESCKTVASKDKRARTHFGNICLHIEEFRDVVWVNPDVVVDKCIEWLKSGAPVEAKRQLGHQHRDQ